MIGEKEAYKASFKMVTNALAYCALEVLFTENARMVYYNVRSLQMEKITSDGLMWGTPSKVASSKCRAGNVRIVF